jgi:nucleoid-associated protein YgaU
MKIRSAFRLGTLLIAPAIAAQTHIVQEGDVLSKIVLKKYPNPDYKIYGPSGKIKDILKLNPQLKGPHLIYPNQEII